MHLQICQETAKWFSSTKLWKIAHWLSKGAQCSQGVTLNCTSWFLPSTLPGSLISSSHWLLMHKILEHLTTNVQDLEHSIKGSTKSGKLKIGQGYFLRYRLPDSLYCLSSGCMTYLQCITGHQGPCLLSDLCNLAVFHQVTLTSTSRQKISFNNMFQKSWCKFVQ